MELFLTHLRSSYNLWRLLDRYDYKCEICGIESQAPVRWFLIHCSDFKLGIYKWDQAEADQARALHFCGEAHAQVYISRWFESFCGSPVMHTGGIA